MEEWRSIILVIHLIATVFMAAPLYMLIIVNERARFGLPPGYNTDRYMENIIKRQPVRCYAYLAVILITGLLLTRMASLGWTSFFSDWTLAIKAGTFVLLTAFLSYVHFGIQPKIENILSTVEPDALLSDEKRSGLIALRTRRKKLSGICLFLVLSSVLAGARLTMGLSTMVFVSLIVLSALFAWRAYKIPIPRGWF